MEVVLAVAALLVLLVAAVQVYNKFAKSKSAPKFLDPEMYKNLPLIDKKVVSHNTRRFRFELPTSKTVLGLPIGQHMTFKFTDTDGKDVFRPYTPVTDDDTPGHVDFVIKVYPAGKMSQYLDHLKVGDSLLVKGPKGRFTYQPHSLRAVGMLAGGSGITPMFQVANAILKDTTDKTDIRLIFANVTVEDILIRDELDALSQQYPRFKVYYVLNEAPEGWQGGVGFVTTEMIKDFLPSPGQGVKILRCGPLPMNKAMKAHLDALSYTPDMLFEF